MQCVMRDVQMRELLSRSSGGGRLRGRGVGVGRFGELQSALCLVCLKLLSRTLSISPVSLILALTPALTPELTPTLAPLLAPSPALDPPCAAAPRTLGACAS